MSEALSVTSFEVIDPHRSIGYYLTQKTMTSSFNLVTDFSRQPYVYVSLYCMFPLYWGNRPVVIYQKNYLNII